MKRPTSDRESRIFSQALWIWPNDWRWDIRNAFAFFRHDFSLDRVPRTAPLFITADQSYHLYVNGAFVGRGPARGFQSHWPYDEIDIARWLVPGRNVLAIRAYNPGFGNFQYLCAGYAGLLVSAQWDKFTLLSDRTWKCLPQPGIRRDTIQASMQLFPQEHVDTRLSPIDWMTSDFDDSSWQHPVGQRWDCLPWASLEPRGIPLLSEEALRPGRIIGVGEGVCGEDWAESRNLYTLRQAEDHTHQPATGDAAYFEVPATGENRFRSFLIDLGKPVFGNFSFTLGGARGGETLDFIYTEIIDEKKLEPVLNFPDGSRVTLSARVVARAGRTEHMFYHPFGFRHVTVTVRNATGPLTLALAFRRTGYPVEQLGAFKSSDRTLEQIWETCVNSQKNCMLDAYVDTPWREQAQWWGDARVQAWNTFHLSGDARLFRRGIYQIGAQTTADGVTYGHAPTMAHNCVLPDFTLIWMMTLWDYYWQTGDLQPFKDHRAVIERALAYFETHTGPQGLVTYDPRYWLFLDWTDLYKDGAPTVYNLWLMLVLEKLATLHRLARDVPAARRCEKWAGKLRTALKKLVDRRGLLRDGYDGKGKIVASTSPHAQILALMAGLAPKSDAIMENFLLAYLDDETPHKAKPSAYWITYLYTLLASRGHGAKIVAHLRPRWEKMIAYGSTFELFEDHPEFPISHSHAWSAHPLFHLMQIIGGVRQTSPGWKTVHFAPDFIGDHGGATIPCPHGLIRSEWSRANGKINVSLALPRGVTASVVLPGVKAARITGRKTWTIIP